MLKKLLVLLFLMLVTLIPCDSRPAVECYYMAKIIRIIEPNYYLMDNLYTHKKEYFIVAGTYAGRDYKTNLEAINYLNRYIDLPSHLVTVQSYGHDRYGRVIGDIVGLDRVSRLSYDLIVNGYCYWYVYFDPYDGMARSLSIWAVNHHSGVYRQCPKKK